VYLHFLLDFIYFHEPIDFSLTSVTSSHVQIWKIVTKILVGVKVLQNQEITRVWWVWNLQSKNNIKVDFSSAAIFYWPFSSVIDRNRNRPFNLIQNKVGYRSCFATRVKLKFRCVVYMANGLISKIIWLFLFAGCLFCFLYFLWIVGIILKHSNTWNSTECYEKKHVGFDAQSGRQ
jgi:hypothetical protein